MNEMIDYEKFDFYSYKSDDIGIITIDEVISPGSKYLVIAEKDIDSKVMIRYYGNGNTLEEAMSDCKKTIEDYLFP